MLGDFIAPRFRAAGSIFQTSIRRALDAAVQISAFEKLKLAYRAQPLTITAAICFQIVFSMAERPERPASRSIRAASPRTVNPVLILTLALYSNG